MEIQLENIINNFKSQSETSMSLHDLRGNFLIFNQACLKHFDQSKQQLFTKSIFDLMILFSKNQLQASDLDQNGFNFTIYSQKNRKKYFKMLLKYQKVKNQPNHDLDIYYKYLMSLSSKICKVKVRMSGLSLQTLLNDFQGIVYCNKNNNNFEKILQFDDPQQQFDEILYLIETVQSELPQQFDYNLMKTIDKKIIKYEAKIVQNQQNQAKKKQRQEQDDNKQNLNDNKFRFF